MAQDELGHARALYPLLRSLMPDSGAEVEPETRSVFESLVYVETPFAGWEDFVAANFLVDTALTVVFEAARDSSFEALAARSRKVVQEERMHFQHGEAWVRRMARQGDAVRAALTVSLNRAWDELLCWFGTPDSESLYSVDGTLDAPVSVLRQRFVDRVVPVLREESVAVPFVNSEVGTTWILDHDLPWATWDDSRGQLRG